MNKTDFIDKSSQPCGHHPSKPVLARAVKTAQVFAFTCCLLGSGISSAWAAGLTAQLNADQVAVDDQFQLILSTDNATATVPDLRPLQQDFNVVGTSQSMQTQIINGRKSTEQRWLITLSAKRTGKFTIPAIIAGNLSSAPLSIDILSPEEQPKSVGGEGGGEGVQGIALSVKLESNHGFLFQEIPVTLRIETTQSLQQASLTAPEGDDFELSAVGESKRSQRLEAGQKVNVIEQQYLLRPQKSGAITLPPFVLRGKMAINNNVQGRGQSNVGQQTRSRGLGAFDQFPSAAEMMRQFAAAGFNDPFFNGSGTIFNQAFGQGNAGKPFKVRSDAITLDIAADPVQSNQWFLPAKAVTLESQWMPSASPAFQVGEAITREVSLFALGAQQEQLPELVLDKTDGVKVYLDSSDTDQAKTAQGTVARRITQLSIIPTKAGKVTLPEIKVSWFNTDTQQAETAILAAQTIEVASALATARTADRTGANKAAANMATSQPPRLIDSAEAVGAKADSTIQEPASKKDKFISSAIALLLLTMMIIAAVIYRRQWVKKKRAQQKSSAAALVKRAASVKAPQTPRAKKAPLQEDEWLQQLEKALRAPHAETIYRLLLQWQRQQNSQRQGEGYDQLINLEQQQRLNTEIKSLEKWLYATDLTQRSNYDGRGLQQLVKALKGQYKKQQRERQKSTKHLAPLYPAH